MYSNQSNNLYNNLANSKKDDNFKGSYLNSNNVDFYNFDLNDENDENEDEFLSAGLSYAASQNPNHNQTYDFEYETFLNQQTFGNYDNFENEFEFDEDDTDEIDDNIDFNRIINSVILKQNDPIETATTLSLLTSTAETATPTQTKSQFHQLIVDEKPPKSNSARTDTNTTQVVQILVDDLLDQRFSLRQAFKNDILDMFDCRCDPSQGTFITKNSKLNKSLQRKLSNFYQLLFNYQLMQLSNETLFNTNMELNEETLNEWLKLNAPNANPSKISQIVQNSTQNQDFKNKLFRSMRSIIERILIDALSLCDQYFNQVQQQELLNNSSAANNGSSLTTNTNNKLWSEIRSRGCQFLGPQMQDDVLKLILHALETVTRMSRKILVLYVVHRLKKQYPKASKTSVGHVVQLLYRAGCFKVEKRENDSSLMELKKEYSKYLALRRQHDSQIIQIALEAGIRMSPEQWSQKLFGDSSHKSEMQSIIDKLQSLQTLEKLISDFYSKILTPQNGNPTTNEINSVFLQVKEDLDYFSSINFEKKQQKQNLAKRASGSLSSKVSDSNTNLNSAPESLASEDDNESSLNNDYDDEYDLDTDEVKISRKNSLIGGKLNKQEQQQQVKIDWSLLNECMKRFIKILCVHVEYSSKMIPIIQANNAFLMLNSAQLNNKKPTTTTTTTTTTMASTKPVVTLRQISSNNQQQVSQIESLIGEQKIAASQMHSSSSSISLASSNQENNFMNKSKDVLEAATFSSKTTNNVINSIKGCLIPMGPAAVVNTKNFNNAPTNFSQQRNNNNNNAFNPQRAKPKMNNFQPQPNNNVNLKQLNLQDMNNQQQLQQQPFFNNNNNKSVLTSSFNNNSGQSSPNFALQPTSPNPQNYNPLKANFYLYQNNNNGNNNNNMNSLNTSPFLNNGSNNGNNNNNYGFNGFNMAQNNVISKPNNIQKEKFANFQNNFYEMNNSGVAMANKASQQQQQQQQQAQKNHNQYNQFVASNEMNFKYNMHSNQQNQVDYNSSLKAAKFNWPGQSS